MRSFLAGLVAIFLFSSGAMAQAIGFVESIGIDGTFRPDHWTPIRVNLTSQVSDPIQYQLQVWQEDLDKDKAVFTKDITLSPKAQEKFELYFLPETALANVDQNTGSPTIPVGELAKHLKVRLCIAPGEGKRPEDARIVINQLDIRFSATNIDPATSNISQHGSRVVLAISDGNSQPSFVEYFKSTGVVEDPLINPLHPADLGENILFYSGVDAVIWFSGNADELSAGGSHRLEALEQFVRRGGKLVICQPLDRHKIEALGSLLPVEMKDAAGNWLINFAEKDHFVDSIPQNLPLNSPKPPPLDALPELSQSVRKAGGMGWHLMNSDGKHPIRIARATAKPDAIVTYWQNWSNTPADRTPYIVRRPYGLGCVTWVAQDLGEINITGPGSGNWPHIWDNILDWHNDSWTPTDSVGLTDDETKRQGKVRESGGYIDFGYWMLRGTDYAGKGAVYVTLAILFFILYWIGAGPVSYLVLRAKKRKEWNWFIYGAWAFVGTAMTVLLVRLVLRGDAEVRHLTVVRQSPGDTTYIYSRIGLYVPRDGEQTISLENTSHQTPSYITPLQVHPAYAENTNFPAAQIYAIPVHDDPQPVNVKIPFRSTAKKLEAEWSGEMPPVVTGSAKLIAENKGLISGTLANQAGTDLKNIYFVFNYESRGGRAVDRVLFVPFWKEGKSLDLGAEYAGAKDLYIENDVTNKSVDPATANNKSSVKGMMHNGNIAKPGTWSFYWMKGWGASMMATANSKERAESDYNSSTAGRGFPIMSLFDRIVPYENSTEEIQGHSTGRVEFIRRGGLVLNMSPSVAAGRLVVLAESSSDDRPLPFPLDVEGGRVGGEGRVLYQIALPVDRSEMAADAQKAEEVKGVSMSVMIKTVNLTKRYGTLVALSNLNLEINEGDCYGFIGPNGAGKSTTIKILATLLQPTWGEARVCDFVVGYQSRQIRPLIGYVPDYFGAYEDMVVQEYLEFFAAAYGINGSARTKIVNDVLELTDLAYKRDALVDGLSRGMKQRLSIGRVLVHDPKVLLLDEPAGNLDPRARIEMRELLKELQRREKTILISSHILPELADLCNKVGIIEQGELLYSGPVADIVKQAKTGTILHVTVAENSDLAAAMLSQDPNISEVRAVNSHMEISLKDGVSDFSFVSQRLVAAGYRLTMLKEEEVNLETAFMRLTKGMVQ